MGDGMFAGSVRNPDGSITHRDGSVTPAPGGQGTAASIGGKVFHAVARSSDRLNVEPC